MAPAVASKRCSMKMIPPSKESEDALCPFCLSLFLREERERKTLSEKWRTARWLSVAREALRCHSNGHHFNSRAPTRVSF
jgi:hypothetical protein